MTDDQHGVIIFVVLEFGMAVVRVDDTLFIVSENVIASSDSSGNWPILEVIFDLSGMSWFKDLEV